ncbi:uncharacterized protein LOC135096140 isoform X2 [Scylla paramamosain]|uniref:uncharacterized protein LOC135096140 isoform X2 n=1 Tax=Scylla paramamosain TaxID=85552 RepID=UPI003083C990
MGSSCLIKTCSVKRTRIGASFHRLPWKHPSLHATLQHAFGVTNVRELTRWSRICSWHIAQLAPLASTHEAVRRLMEYYAWNARSYKRIFELSRRVGGENEQEQASGEVRGGVGVGEARGEAAYGDGAGQNWVHSSGEETKQGYEEMKEEEKERQYESVLTNLLLHVLSGALANDAHTPPSYPPSLEGGRSMIPDDCAAGAMDAARDPDAGLEDAGKSKKTEDINDNHTKVKEGEDDDEGDDESASMTNGEVAEVQSGRESDANEERVEEEGESEVKEVEEGEEGESGVQAEGSDEDKESSEDDEDKLVISEGNDKPPEDSADDSSKGEPPVVPPSKAPSTTSPPDSPRRSEKRPAEGEGEGEAALDSPSKRPRPLEDLVCLDALTSLSQVEGSLLQIKRDLEAVEFLVKQKEEEWNTLLRLQKRKEELYIRLARRRQTLLMQQEEGAGAEQGEEGRSSSSSSNLLFLPQGGYSSLSGPQLPLMMMSQLLGSSASAQALQMVGGPAVVRTREGSPNTDTSATTTNNGNISVIDIHTSSNKAPGDRSKISHEAQSKLTRHISSAMKPILPKPPGGGVGSLPTSLSFSATGQGPQGPTVNVQHLIAAHRKENPNTPPISSKHLTPRRATRGAWRNRYDGDKRPTPPHRDQERPPSVSSSSSDAESRTAGMPAGLPPSSKSLLTLNDPSVSYKDVLLRFAELTQIEKQPGSPQISIFPVASNEGPGKRSDLSRESTPGMRSHTPPTHLPPSASSVAAAPTPKPGLEAPSALAKLLLESRGGVSSSGLKGVGGGVGEATPNSHYLTLSALLSGGSTTTVKDKLSHAQVRQSEGRSKKATTTTSSSSSNSQPGEEGSGNPKCQGCHKQRAQFVCAGCGNQWYCSRECQVSSWEEHSEHCSN